MEEPWKVKRPEPVDRISTAPNSRCRDTPKGSPHFFHPPGGRWGRKENRRSFFAVRAESAVDRFRLLLAQITSADRVLCSRAECPRRKRCCFSPVLSRMFPGPDF